MRQSLLSAAACLVFSVTASAQLMPHDNWRVSGVSFGSPTNNNLRSIAIGSGGVYVAEINGGNPTQILQFSEVGAYIRRFSTDFGYIHGIACDAAGNVYVLSRGLTRVRVFDANGTALREWGQWGTGDGQFDLEGSTGNTMIGIDKNNEVYVCDPGNARVQVFSTTGTFLRKWGMAGSLPGQFPAGAPSVICVLDSGKVLTSNYGYSTPQLRIFDKLGVYLTGMSFWNYGNNEYIRGICPSHDGLAFVGNYVADNAASGINARILDQAEGFANIGGMPAVKADGGAAFSARGDFFSVSGNRIAIAYREYSNASNFPAAPAIPQPSILAASQRPGTNLVDLDYWVKDADSATVTTGLLAVRDGNTLIRTGYSVPARTFVEGTAANIGTDQPTGESRHLVWNMPADWGIDYATFEFEILAKDSRNLLGLHWITVPASGGAPAIQVSSAPITNPQIRDLYLWYLATGQINQTYVNASNGWIGTIWGKSGVYTGIKLSEDYNNPSWEASRVIPTPAGLVYAYEQMGAHPITPAELARAQAGKYGFSSVDSNSIVKNLAPVTSYLKGWGRNDYGQANWQPFAVPNISKIASGGHSTFFIRADGTLWAMGYNNVGQLGDGTTTTRSGPIQIATGVDEVATSGEQTLFVKTDGTLWAMGYNNYGQLGDGTTTNRLTPVQVATEVSKVACGNGHSLFLKTDGVLWAMGYNLDGRLGDGTTIHRSTPVQVTTDVTQISAGAGHSLYVKTDETLWAMGLNNYGQLGVGNTTNRTTPVQVDTGVRQASACGYADNYYGHSVFVKTDNTLWAMGRNSHGQLGDGTTAQRLTPVPIATEVSQAYGGALHTVFMKTDHTLWSTGHNGNGQLGDYTTTDRSAPAQFDVNATAIAVGGWHSLAITLP